MDDDNYHSLKQVAIKLEVKTKRDGNFRANAGSSSKPRAPTSVVVEIRVGKSTFNMSIEE